LEIGILIGAKYNDGGALESQVALQGNDASCTPGLAYSPFGFKGRPRSADPPDAQGNYQNGALVLYWYEGSVLHTMPLDDGRRSTKLPQLDEGCSIFYADVDDAYAQWATDGSLNVKTANGKMNVGDDPVALALGSALKALLDAIAGVTASNTETGLAALQQAIKTITDIQTNTLMGT
jgi:hypothetical protein